MYDEYYDDFYEPGEFDEKLEELKEALKASVRKEVCEEIERLREENKKLQGIKEHFEEVKRDYERKKNECERVMRDAEYKAKRARIAELMENYKTVLWCTAYEYRYKKKCEKCDDSRNIQITLPSGREVNDPCDCKINGKVIVPQMNIRYEMADRNGSIKVWYKRAGKEHEEYFIADCVAYVPKLIVNHNMNFEDIPDDRTVYFTTEEECQEFCDYLNEKNGANEYKYDVEGKLCSRKAE